MSLAIRPRFLLRALAAVAATVGAAFSRSPRPAPTPSRGKAVPGRQLRMPRLPAQFKTDAGNLYGVPLAEARKRPDVVAALRRSLGSQSVLRARRDAGAVA